MRRRAAFLALLAALAAGCGSGEEVRPLPEGVEGTVPTQTEPATTQAEEKPAGEGDPAAGKEVFTSAGCTTCHTLKDANSTGTIGPNLDDAKPSAELVIERVTNGKGAMPSFKDQLTEQQIRDVAAYVSQAAGG